MKRRVLRVNPLIAGEKSSSARAQSGSTRNSASNGSPHAGRAAFGARATLATLERFTNGTIGGKLRCAGGEVSTGVPHAPIDPIVGPGSRHADRCAAGGLCTGEGVLSRGSGRVAELHL